MGSAALAGQPSVVPYQGTGNGSFTALTGDTSSDSPSFLAVSRGQPPRAFVVNAPDNGPDTLAAYDINSDGSLTAINQVRCSSL